MKQQTLKLLGVAPLADTNPAAFSISVGVGQRVKIAALLVNFVEGDGSNRPVSIVISDGDANPFRSSLGVVAANDTVNVSGMLSGYFRGDTISANEDGNAPLPDVWWTKNITVQVQQVGGTVFQFGEVALWYYLEEP